MSFLFPQMEHLKACAEVATTRTSNWQKFCQKEESKWSHIGSIVYMQIINAKYILLVITDMLVVSSVMKPLSKGQFDTSVKVSFISGVLLSDCMANGKIGIMKVSLNRVSKDWFVFYRCAGIPCTGEYNARWGCNSSEIYLCFTDVLAYLVQASIMLDEGVSPVRFICVLQMCWHTLYRRV